MYADAHTLPISSLLALVSLSFNGNCSVFAPRVLSVRPTVRSDPRTNPDLLSLHIIRYMVGLGIARRSKDQFASRPLARLPSAKNEKRPLHFYILYSMPLTLNPPPHIPSLHFIQLHQLLFLLISRKLALMLAHNNIALATFASYRPTSLKKRLLAFPGL